MTENKGGRYGLIVTETRGLLLVRTGPPSVDGKSSSGDQSSLGDHTPLYNAAETLVPAAANTAGISARARGRNLSTTLASN